MNSVFSIFKFLSSLAQDFIEDESRRDGTIYGRSFLSSLAQDFIEDRISSANGPECS